MKAILPCYSPICWLLSQKDGVLNVHGARKVMGPMSLSGGVLSYDFSDTVRPSLAVERMSVDGPVVVRLANVPRPADAPIDLVLVSGAHLSSEDVSRVTLALEGDSSASVKASLFVSDAGDLCVKVEERRGFMLIIR